MPSELDVKLDAIMDGLTAPGGMMTLTTHEDHGITLPMIATAPPALSYYFQHFCTQHGDKDFLVSGEERLSFAQVYQQARAVAGALVQSHGVQRGDHIGIAMRNAPSWIWPLCSMAGGPGLSSPKGSRTATPSLSSPIRPAPSGSPKPGTALSL
jgi:long-chain acyl-CoA synthetase